MVTLFISRQLGKGLLFSVYFILATIVSIGQNPIVDENLLPGTPQTVWDAGEGPGILGFATDFSVNKGSTVHFKININSATALPYTVEIYRIGYYQGNGARFIANLGPSLTGQSQPAYLYEPATGKVDCSNWAESASWAVPPTAVSGMYIARLYCPSLNSSSLIFFVVRDDNGNSPILFKTSDATWQAYNNYGGNTFYAAAKPVPGFSHAVKVSYQRPTILRGDKTNFFNSEYPMIRWLEKNGYNISYATDLDMARDASVFTPAIHKIILAVGHDEYYSLEQRTKLENARANGVHIAFFSGNEVYWKTRWEDNYKTLVCYKEGTQGDFYCGYKCDPLPNVWTGLWRDGCAPTYAPNDGCNPEASLSGQISWTQSTGSIKVPDTYKKLRFWKNTSVALLGAGQTAVLPYGTLGNEWDPVQLGFSYPSHRVILSNTTQTNYVHRMSLYRHNSGALIFGAGTMQWAWGLDDKHDLNTATPPVQPVSIDMQQATVNLLHDMGVTAGTLQAGLIEPTTAPDALAPNTTITSPVHGATVSGAVITISGTSLENGTGAVGGVEVSIDNGTTWNTATGLENWTYTFSPVDYGAITVKVRAWDDVGNVEIPGSPGSSNCIIIHLSGPFNYSVFNATYPNAEPAFFTGAPVELGMKFQSTVPGYITGFRYYKDLHITGVHTGHLWSSTGTLLATKIFSNETGMGWQSVALTTPVAIAANTTYVVSYFTASGDFTRQDPFFTQTISNGFLRGLANGTDGGNGVYEYSNTPAFPFNTIGSSNYFADVTFVSSDATAPQVVSVTPLNNASSVPTDIRPTATLNETVAAGTISTSTVIMKGPGNVIVPGTVSVNGPLITFIPNTGLAINTLYTVTLKGGNTEPLIKDLSGNPLGADYVWTFTTASTQVPFIATHPVSQTVCPNTAVTFTSVANGIPAPSVQWQVSTDNGGIWNNIVAATNATYTFTATVADNNKQFRARWNNSAGTINSNPAILTVDPFSPVLAGTMGAAAACSNSIMQPSGISFSDGSCNLIATVVPSGVSPVSGTVSTCVKLESTVLFYFGQPIVQRHYDINPSVNTANSTATVTLYFTQQEFDAYNLQRGLNPALPVSGADNIGIGNLLVTQFHGTGTAPGNYPGPAVLINPLDNNIIWAAAMNRWEISFDVNGFSGFYVHTSSSNGPLPVWLQNFSGINKGNINLLEWTTSSEQNSSHFDLFRSTDGINFIKTGSVIAAGNSNTSRSYNYTDNVSSLQSNLFYYKLGMADISGSTKYSSIVKIKRDSKGFNVDISPVPFTGQLRVSIETTVQENATISMNDVSGKKIQVSESLLRKGSNVITLEDLTNIPAGIYLLTVTTASQHQTVKVIKQ